MDLEARFAAIKAKREATGLGLNVRFLREDGTRDMFSFNSVERAEAFRASLRRQGRVILP